MTAVSLTMHCLSALSLFKVFTIDTSTRGCAHWDCIDELITVSCCCLVVNSQLVSSQFIEVHSTLCHDFGFVFHMLCYYATGQEFGCIGIQIGPVAQSSFFQLNYLEYTVILINIRCDS